MFQYLVPLSRGFGLESPDIEKPQNPSKNPEPSKPLLKKKSMQDSWLLLPGLCLNRTAVRWRNCYLFAFLCFGEWLSESRFGTACTFLLLMPPRVIWSLDAILTVRKKHLLSFSVFLFSLALFLRGASCKLCLMQFGRIAKFQTEIMANFLSSCECNHTWENQLHRNDFWVYLLSVTAGVPASLWLQVTVAFIFTALIPWMM